MKKYSGAYFYNNEMMEIEGLWRDRLTGKGLSDPDSFHLEGVLSDSLRFVGFQSQPVRGYFASVSTNTIYSATATNFEHILINCPSKNGVYTGLFSFKRYNDRYSLCLVDDKSHQFSIPKHPDPADSWLTALQNKGLKLV